MCSEFHLLFPRSSSCIIISLNQYLFPTAIRPRNRKIIFLNTIPIKMVRLFSQLRNITTGRQLYKDLLRKCEQLPGDASKFYKHSIKQSFKQHIDETNPERIKEIIDRALEDSAWVLNKYKKSN